MEIKSSSVGNQLQGPRRSFHRCKNGFSDRPWRSGVEETVLGGSRWKSSHLLVDLDGLRRRLSFQMVLGVGRRRRLAIHQDAELSPTRLCLFLVFLRLQKNVTTRYDTIDNPRK